MKNSERLLEHWKRPQSKCDHCSFNQPKLWGEKGCGNWNSCFRPNDDNTIIVREGIVRLQDGTINGMITSITDALDREESSEIVKRILDISGFGDRS